MENPFEAATKKLQEVKDSIKTEVLYVCEKTFRRETVRLELSRLVTLETQHGNHDEATRYQSLLDSF